MIMDIEARTGRVWAELSRDERARWRAWWEKDAQRARI